MTIIQALRLWRWWKKEGEMPVLKAIYDRVNGLKTHIVGGLMVLTGLAQMAGLDLGPISSTQTGWDLVLDGGALMAGRSALAKLIALLRAAKGGPT